MDEQEFKQINEEGFSKVALEYYLELEKILDCVHDGIIVVNKGTIFLVNKEAEYIFDYSRNKLRGQKIEILIPDTKKGSHESDRKGYEREPRARPMGLNVQGLRSDKEIVELEAYLDSYVSDQMGLMTTVTFRRKNEHLTNE